MAYISAKEVAEIRKELKKEFPNYRFGVRKNDYLSVSVTVKKGPAFEDEVFTHGEGYAQINHYHLHNYGKKAQKFFEKIVKIIKTAPAKADGGRAYYDNSDAMIDYFDTAFYFHVNVGDWNKPYEVVNGLK